jgi:uncharacterized membrane protein YedE/YeeE
LLRHNISDEELEMLTQDTRDGLSEAFWAFTGAAIAVFPTAVDSLWKAFIVRPATPLDPLQLVNISIVVGTVVGAAILRIVWSRRSNRARALAANIRARQTQ